VPISTCKLIEISEKFVFIDRKEGLYIAPTKVFADYSHGCVIESNRIQHKANGFPTPFACFFFLPND
jgi:hypothetical protein